MTRAPESDAAYGARVMAGVVCQCGSPDLIAVKPGHEGYRVTLLGESSEGPGRTFAIEADRAVRGWCAGCWPNSPSQNRSGACHVG